MSFMSENPAIRYRRFCLHRLLRHNNYTFSSDEYNTAAASSYIVSARPKLLDAAASIIKRHFLQDHSAFPILEASGLFDTATSQRIALVEMYEAMSADTAIPKTFCSICNQTLPTVASWPTTPVAYRFVPDSTKVKLELALPKVPKRPTKRFGLVTLRGDSISSNSTFFTNLPPELIEIVFAFCDAEDVWNLGKVNRKLRDMVSDQGEVTRGPTHRGVKIADPNDRSLGTLVKIPGRSSFLLGSNESRCTVASFSCPSSNRFHPAIEGRMPVLRQAENSEGLGTVWLEVGNQMCN